jgi:G6PDH family F420-dependent oxidoreductase
VSHEGDFFSVHEARLFSAPRPVPPIAVAASGRESWELAARSGAALVAVNPIPELVGGYRDAGGKGPCYAQIGLSYDTDEASAVKTPYSYLRYALLGWKVMSELPNPVNFQAAAKPLREDDVEKAIPCGPDAAMHVEGIKKYADAGFDRVAVLQAGPNQAAFLRFWIEELRPALARAGLAERVQETAASVSRRTQ